MNLKFIPVVLLLLVVAYLAGLSFTTRNNRLKAENPRQLSPCPDTPNCVSSLSTQAKHAIDALALIDNDSPLSWNTLTDAIVRDGGEILVNDGQYLHAVFTSSVFRFKDDFEAKLNDKQIEVRSASRAGRSDLGQNRKRVERIQTLYHGSPSGS